jgi:D-methionine transport system substrate-binding protein
MKKALRCASALAAALALAAATTANAFDKNHPTLTFSKSMGPYSELFISGVQPILEKEGYKVKSINLSDLLQADLALNEGEVDFNVEQHVAFMQSFNRHQNGHLAALTPIPTVPSGIYPGAKNSLSDVEDGDNIAIPSDASNTARAYAILQKIGWIKLDPKKDLSSVTKDDVIENPHHLKFTEMRSLNIPAVATDFAYIVITGSVVYNAKIDPQTALATETIQPHLLLQLVVEEQNKDSVWAQDIKKAYQSKEFKDYMKKTNTGLWYLPTEEDIKALGGK